MANELEIKIKAQLDKLLNGLAEVEKLASSVGKGMAAGTKQVNDEVAKQTTKVASGLEKVSGKIKSIFHDLKHGAEIMAGLIGLEGALDIKDTIVHSIKSTLSLADTVRKLGPIFGVAGKDFGKFQEKITKGMGEAGLSTEAAKNALQGLAETQVRGAGNLTSYAKNAGELAEATGTRGSEGQIAKLLAGVTTAKGGNVNDTEQMHKIASDVLSAYNATGMKPEAILSGMQSIFESLPQDLRQSVTTKGLAGAAATESVVPGAMKVITELMKSPIARKSFEAQGFDVKKMFSGSGFDVNALAKAIKGVMSRVASDPKLAVTTAGFSDEAAEAAVRFTEKTKEATAVTEKVTKAHADLAKQAIQSRGLGEAFDAALDQTKATLSGYLEPALHATIDTMSKMSQSKAGGAAVGAAGFMMGSLIFGKLGSMITDKLGMSAGSSMAGAIQGKAINDLVGGGVQNVYMINVDELAAKMSMASNGGAGLAGGASKFGQIMKSLGAVAIGAGAGIAIGTLINDYAEKNTQGTNSRGEKGDIITRGGFAVMNAVEDAENRRQEQNDALIKGVKSFFGGGSSKHETKVVIQAPMPGLKVQKTTTRGASMGPHK